MMPRLLPEKISFSVELRETAVTSVWTVLLELLE
jgi:hypothetical protein